ncbi:RE1-silencing transcription factor B-like [Saccostrea echinata]|uniref:RE1-silencing transcription factor B-like n=1 Tax=Saccostrea echinata TaxID=191078 RepID=UPI002A83A19E|nr:RE1-silencing transcription factor B-like [Saccostrea echinata]
MAKTKTTPRNEYRRCPMCSEPARTEEEFKKHIMVCAMRVFECPTCDFTNTRELNLKRHIKRCHPGLGPNDELIKLGAKEQNSSSSSSSSDENEEDDIDEQKEKQDPEKKEDNLLEGRLFRKKTQPTLPFARKRPSLEEIPVPKKIILMDKATQVDMEPAVPPVESSGVDVYTQTSPKKREVVTRTTRKFREGEADIKVVAKERMIYN